MGRHRSRNEGNEEEGEIRPPKRDGRRGGGGRHGGAGDDARYRGKDDMIRGDEGIRGGISGGRGKKVPGDRR